MANSPDPVDVRRRAGWLPPSQEGLEAWLSGHREKAEGRGDQPLHPAVAAFGELIDGDPVLRMYAERMIEEVPRAKEYSERHLESVEQLLRLVDAVLTTAPEFGQEMVTTPLGGVLDWTMGTPSGFAFYRDPRVNAALKEILTAWCEFLSSPDSLYVLNDSPSGWTSEAAREAIGIDRFEHDPDDPHWGFGSWNDFFTRRFKDGERPVASPDDDAVVVNPCESLPYGLTTDVQRRDRFWIKSQPYSLADVLAGDEAVEQFVGGTVWQSFLSATDYHRWHSPVGGTVVRAYTVPGTYYSEADTEGAAAVEPTNSQAYLAHVNTRAVVLLQADDPVIGLVAFVPIGMFEVSSCVLDPRLVPGARVAKGDELGYFQFGGSTQCVVFRPGAIGEFALPAVPQPHDPDAPLMRVRTRLAVAAGPE